MPVHPILTACGDVLYWYEHSRCVSYRNRLYFVIDIGENQCQTLLTAAVSKELTPGDVIFDNEQDINTWRRYNWPVPDFSIGFQLISADTSIPDYKLCCFLMCERVKNTGFVQYIDKINPAFKRLQWWFRKIIWERRKTQRLQFALATHQWLKHDVLQTIGFLIN